MHCVQPSKGKLCQQGSLLRGRKVVRGQITLKYRHGLNWKSGGRETIDRQYVTAEIYASKITEIIIRDFDAYELVNEDSIRSTIARLHVTHLAAFVSIGSTMNLAKTYNCTIWLEPEKSICLS